VETIYLRYESGKLAVRSGSPERPDVPADAVEITQAEYDTELAAMQGRRDERLAGIRAAEQQAAQDDYDALVEAGVSEATARRVSGLGAAEAAAGGTV